MKNSEQNYAVNLFSFPLIHLRVADWESKKKQLEDLKNSQTFHILPDEYSVTDFKPGDFNYNDKITSIFHNEIDSFGQLMGLKVVTVTAAWFQIANRGQHHPVHTHGAYGFSAICYLNFDSNIHKGVRLMSPNLNFINGLQQYFDPEVEEGSLIFFPSQLFHFVLPNETDIKREILSFNVTISF